MHPTTVLRIEGLALFGAATAAYVALGAPLWLFLLLALAPDLSMLGYLAGPRVGSRLYNLFHTTVAPITLGALGLLTGAALPVWIALVWAAHVGADRAVGYGLKYPTGFERTHLTRVDARTDPGCERPDGYADPVAAGRE